MGRVILHCDLNNFYASVACLYHPEIRDKPVAVCGSQSTRHGIVLAKNIIAKEMGVKTAEPIWEARQKCPQLIAVRPDYPLYLRFSVAARRIYERYTDQVESFGIDESWLDVTESTRLFGDGEKIAYKIKDTIKNELGITASVGVSYNKIFAKLGSDLKKPDAVTSIHEENFKEKIWKLPADNLLYVGRSTRARLDQLGILTIGDLAAAHPRFLVQQFGKWGEMLWSFANGHDMTPVNQTDDEALIKGIGNSLTTPRDLVNNDDVKILIHILADSVGERLRRHNLKGRTVQIWIRDSELHSIDRQAQLPHHTYVSPEIAEKAYEIFLASWDWTKNIRSLGIRVTQLITADTCIQISLFDDARRLKRERLDCSIDRIRERFGHYAVQRAITLTDKRLNANPASENIIHPVSFYR